LVNGFALAASLIDPSPRPHIDIPSIIRLHREGRISFDGLITHEFPLEGINEALAVVRSGSAGRVLLNVAAK
jgi:S-(hydroxymethyl)glutathione dehydrogenase / alcohol dehydrogenase